MDGDEIVTGQYGCLKSLNIDLEYWYFGEGDSGGWCVCVECA